MEVSVKIKDAVPPYAVIYTEEVTEEVSDAIASLNGEGNHKIFGHRDNKVFLLNYKDIYYFYCEEKKVFAKTEEGVFKVKQRLYELEILVKGRGFVKLSSSSLELLKKLIILK